MLVGDGGGGVDHEVDGAGGFGKGDDLAEAGGAGEDHDDAIEAEGDAAVGWGAVLEGVEEEAEALLRFLVRHAERAEDFGLDVFAVDTDGAGAEFGAVEDDVVGERADGALVVDEATGGDVVLVGRGEGMVRGLPGLGFLVPLVHGEESVTQRKRKSRAVPVFSKSLCLSAYFLASSSR